MKKKLVASSMCLILMVIVTIWNNHTVLAISRNHTEDSLAIKQLKFELTLIEQERKLLDAKEQLILLQIISEYKKQGVNKEKQKLKRLSKAFKWELIGK